MGGEIKMSSKKRTYTVVAVLLAVIALGIGYAATLLTVTGNAIADPSEGAVLVLSNATNTGGETGTSASADGNTGNCTVHLKTVGDSATCTFDVARDGMDAGVDVTNMVAEVYSDAGLQNTWSASDQWFTITKSIGQSSLTDGQSTTASVTVTLKKANLTSAAVSESFYLVVTGDASNHS